jgi:cell shape-determining protein MreC
MNMTTKATLGVTIVLLIVAMILSLKNYSDKKELFELLAGKQPSPQSAPAATPDLIGDLDRRLREVEDREATIAKLQTELGNAKLEVAETKTLNTIVEDRQKKQEESLSPMALKIKATPAIGKVIGTSADWGFITVNAGSESGIQAGMKCAVRRDHYIIAQVMVDITEPNRATANITGSVAEGMQIMEGDDMIAYPVQ